MRRLLFAILASAALLAPGLPVLAREAAPAAAQAAAPQAAPSPKRARLNGRVFDRVWDLTRKHYYDRNFNGVDWDESRRRFRPQALAAHDETALYRVLGAMLDELNDAHANVLTPTQARYDAHRNVPRPLLGLMLVREDGRYLVQDVRPGSPAEAIELELGWEVRSIDGQPYYPGLPLADGRPVAVDFVDAQGRLRSLVLTPRVMPSPPRRTAHWAAPDVLVLSFDGFDSGVGKWVNQQLASAPPGSHVVLDLRGNRGGLVHEAQNVLSCFLPERTVWVRHRPRGRDEQTMRLRRACKPFAGSLAVLVNGASRSAAELTPGALQDYARAVIVGRRTAGDVLISTNLRLPDGGLLSLSISDVRLPAGERLEHRGVDPDIEAQTTLADRRLGRDPALDAAVAAVRAQ